MAPLTELPAFLASIPVDHTIERFGQIQKFLFQRRFSAGQTLNQFLLATANPNLLASWTPLLTAENNTKVVASPFVSEVENETGEARVYGGGNATINGIEIVLGANPSPMTAKMLESRQSVVKAVRALQRELLGVYLINEHGQIGMITDGLATPLAHRPIPIRSLFVGDKVFGGFDNVDSNALSFVFEPVVMQNFVIVTPTNFNALHDLVNPA